MIINADEVKNIYVSTHFVDMRKSIDGLTLIVHSQFQMNVLGSQPFYLYQPIKKSHQDSLL